MSWLRLQTHLESIPHPLYVYKVFQHHDMLWMGICVRPYPAMPVQVGRGLDFRKIGVGRSLSDVVVSWVWLQTCLQCIPHPLYAFKVFQHHDMLWMGMCVRPYTVMPVQVGRGF